MKQLVNFPRRKLVKNIYNYFISDKSHFPNRTHEGVKIFYQLFNVFCLIFSRNVNNSLNFIHICVCVIRL